MHCFLYRTFSISTPFQHRLSFITFILTLIICFRISSKQFQRPHLDSRLWGLLRASSLTGYVDWFVIQYIILMRVYRQEVMSLWDYAYTWEDGLLSFQYLTWLLIRTSHSITSSNESKDGPGCPKDEKVKLAHQHQQEGDVIQWFLAFLPSSLTEIKIWIKVFAGRTNGKRLAVWMLKYNERQDCNQWEVVCNHPIEGEEVYDGDFI